MSSAFGAAVTRLAGVAADLQRHDIDRGFHFDGAAFGKNHEIV